MMRKDSMHNDQLSTADLAQGGQRSSMQTADESLRSAERPTISQHESNPVVRQDQDRVEAQRPPLLPGNEAERFRERWSEVQTGFVDEPRHAVEQADGMVAEMMQRLAQVFADERHRLEQHWDRDGETNTEELRLALRRYRSFFDRLLAM